jgi:hypothetical protein
LKTFKITSSLLIIGTFSLTKVSLFSQGRPYQENQNNFISGASSQPNAPLVRSRDRLDEIKSRLYKNNANLERISNNLSNNQPAPTSIEQSKVFYPPRVSLSSAINNIETGLAELKAIQSKSNNENQYPSTNEDSFYDNEVPSPYEGDQSPSYWDDQEFNTVTQFKRNSLIGGNYWTFGYSRIGYDAGDYTSNLLSFSGSYEMNENLSGQGTFQIGKASYNQVTQNVLGSYLEDSLFEYGLSGGITYHFELNPGSSTVIKPFIGADLGYEYSIAKFLNEYNINNFMTAGWSLTWGLNIGSELQVGDNLSLAASLRFQDLDPSVIFGLDAAYFFSESFGTSVGLSFGEDYNRFDLSGQITY